MTGKLALIVGSGDLPAHVAGGLATPPVICVLEGNAPNDLAADLTFRVETLGTLLQALAARSVTHVCFCGTIDRPVIDPARLDAATLPLVPTLMAAAQAGDDAALAAVAQIFAQAGFALVGAHEVVPDLAIASGVLTSTGPSEQMQVDVTRGLSVLDALAPLDVGQACVVGQGQVLGIETIGGTDAMLRTLPDVVQRAGAVLIKAPKQGQDLRTDMPTIGPRTIAAVQAAGLAGIAVQAGAVILLDSDNSVAEADAAGLVLWSFDRD